MKTTLVLVLSILALSQCMNLLKEDIVGDWIEKHPNVEWVVDTEMYKTKYVAEELYSFEHNKIKMQYTSYDIKKPAFDILFDYEDGLMFIYYNKTDKCRAFPLEKKNMADMYKKVFDGSEFVAKRGHLDLYTFTMPEEKVKSYLYGKFEKNADEDNELTFTPIRQQTHSDVIRQEFQVEWVDSIGFPKVSADAFDYPKCKKSTVYGETIPATRGIFGANLGLMDLVIENM